MRAFRYSSVALSLSSLVLLATGCLATGRPLSAHKATVSPGAATIEAGQTVQLTAASASPNDTGFTWASSATDIAAVSANGLVAGIAPGSATIAATGVHTGRSGSAAITVLPASEVEGGGEGEPFGTETLMLPGDVPLEMVWIPAGTFMMGRYPGEQDSYPREDPYHPVTLSHGFWLGKYELTKAQWTAVMGTTLWSGRNFVLDDPNSPTVWVSWDSAREFIGALNTYTGKTFRLPSEAEWEYACRAGTATRFYWGDDPNYTAMGNYAWYYYNAYNVGERYAHVVGLKRPNAFGLYDMSGNVWEWCEDDWHANYTGAPADGSAWVDSPRSSGRVGRGGAWGVIGCRSAPRAHYFPRNTCYLIGFRLAR